jgi:hypothetical protein
MKIVVSIEPDEQVVGHFKIAISAKDTGELLSVPVRNLTENEAVRLQNPIMYAFEAGMREQKRFIEKTLYREWDSVEAKIHVC